MRLWSSGEGLLCGSSLLHCTGTEKLWSQGNNISSYVRSTQSVALGQIVRLEGGRLTSQTCDLSVASWASRHNSKKSKHTWEMGDVVYPKTTSETTRKALLGPGRLSLVWNGRSAPCCFWWAGQILECNSSWSWGVITSRTHRCISQRCLNSLRPPCKSSPF